MFSYPLWMTGGDRHWQTDIHIHIYIHIYSLTYVCIIVNCNPGCVRWSRSADCGQWRSQGQWLVLKWYVGLLLLPLHIQSPLHSICTVCALKRFCLCAWVAAWRATRATLPWSGFCGHGSSAVPWSHTDQRSVLHQALLRDSAVKQGPANNTRVTTIHA